MHMNVFPLMRKISTTASGNNSSPVGGEKTRDISIIVIPIQAPACLGHHRLIGWLVLRWRVGQIAVGQSGHE